MDGLAGVQTEGANERSCITFPKLAGDIRLPRDPSPNLADGFEHVDDRRRRFIGHMLNPFSYRSTVMAVHPRASPWYFFPNRKADWRGD